VLYCENGARPYCGIFPSSLQLKRPCNTSRDGQSPHNGLASTSTALLLPDHTYGEAGNSEQCTQITGVRGGSEERAGALAFDTRFPCPGTLGMGLLALCNFASHESPIRHRRFPLPRVSCPQPFRLPQRLRFAWPTAASSREFGVNPGSLPVLGVLSAVLAANHWLAVSSWG